MTKPADRQLNELFATASPAFLSLFRKPEVSHEDIIQLSWIERYVIAQDLWSRCTAMAKRAMAHDAHPGVRDQARRSVDTIIKPISHGAIRMNSDVKSKSVYIQP